MPFSFPSFVVGVLCTILIVLAYKIVQERKSTQFSAFEIYQKLPVMSDAMFDEFLQLLSKVGSDKGRHTAFYEIMQSYRFSSEQMLRHIGNNKQMFIIHYEETLDYIVPGLTHVIHQQLAQKLIEQETDRVLS